ncbi:MAG: diphthamide synthesis protein [archaeon]
MKTIHLEARSKQIVRLPKKLMAKLPQRIAIFTTVQYVDSLENMVGAIEKTGRRAGLGDAPHAVYGGQVLGCSNAEVRDCDAILFVGDGNFHPIALAVNSKKPVYVYNPLTKRDRLLDDDDIQPYQSRKLASYAKFLHAEHIGILVSTKPGQNRMDKALELIAAHDDKRFYIMAFGTLDISQLENFPFIDCFVNTACPRLADDEFPRPVINIDDV